MPRISELEDKGREGLSLPNLPWLTKAIGSNLIKGGIYLLAGEPGIGKTTLALQILGELSGQGVKVLYIPTEQSLGDVKRVADRIYGLVDDAMKSSISENLFTDTIDDLSMLPWFLSHRILPSAMEYHGCQVIAIDSLQGGGLTAGVGAKYKALLDFTDTAKGAGITCLFVNHVTKSGEIAGPKALEHAVDCIVYIRRAFRLRPRLSLKIDLARLLLTLSCSLWKRKVLESHHMWLQKQARFWVIVVLVRNSLRLKRLSRYQDMVLVQDLVLRSSLRKRFSNY